MSAPDPPWSTDVLTVTPETSAQDTAWLLTRRHVGSAVVVDGERVVGIVTDRDLALTVLRAGLDPSTTPVSACMSSPVVTHDPAESLTEAVRSMRRHRVRRLPVVEASGKLVGIVAADDALVELARRWCLVAEVVQRSRRREVVPGQESSTVYGRE